MVMVVSFTSPLQQWHGHGAGNPNFNTFKLTLRNPNRSFRFYSVLKVEAKKTNYDKDDTEEDDEESDSLGVKVALSILKFYKREISPVLPRSCRYVPTCSEYSMEAYKKYGFTKGTILTTCRLCRCNPLGGSGFDPPRWFDEGTPSEE